MIVVLTPEQAVAAEHFWINTLLANGLDLLHIRRHWLTDTAMKMYVEGIDAAYRSWLVLHSHHHLAGELGIRRLHFREEDRLSGKYRDYQEGYTLSTSVHSIAAFNDLEKIWNYAFISPVFPSISKQGYGREQQVLQELPLRQNPRVRLIGLGGINEYNYKQVVQAGADGIALLGSIWQREDPLNTFLKCRMSDP